MKKCDIMAKIAGWVSVAVIIISLLIVALEVVFEFPFLSGFIIGLHPAMAVFMIPLLVSEKLYLILMGLFILYLVSVILSPFSFFLKNKVLSVFVTVLTFMMLFLTLIVTVCFSFDFESCVSTIVLLTLSNIYLLGTVGIFKCRKITEGTEGIDGEDQYLKKLGIVNALLHIPVFFVSNVLWFVFTFLFVNEVPYTKIIWMIFSGFAVLAHVASCVVGIVKGVETIKQGKYEKNAKLCTTLSSTGILIYIFVALIYALLLM